MDKGSASSVGAGTETTGALRSVGRTVLAVLGLGMVIVLMIVSPSLRSK
jgi:hypothetical protein